jgi:CMP-N,N'-diacetyllegionaminic acid synthase
MSVTAFIPARSGSKRVPGKNVKLLAGKPLVIWTLEACVRAPSISRVIFSTDSEEYWNLARRHLGEDKLALDYRSPDEAGDKVKIFDYLRDARDKIFAAGDETFFMGLPTVPFRATRHIEEAIALHRSSGKPVFSATEYGFPVSFAFYVEPDGGWTSVGAANPMRTGNTRSQDQRTAYHPNGAMYVRRVADLAKPDLKTLYDGAVPCLMDRNASVDIDNEADFAIASAMVGAGVVS